MTLEDQIMMHHRYSMTLQTGREPLIIGFGRNLETTGISEEEAKMLMRDDIVRIYRDLEKTFPFFRSLQDRRQKVLIDMGFDLGIQGIRQMEEFVAALVHGDWVKAVREMKESSWAKSCRPQRLQNLIVMMEG
jgi:lysozyme